MKGGTTGVETLNLRSCMTFLMATSSRVSLSIAFTTTPKLPAPTGRSVGKSRFVGSVITKSSSSASQVAKGRMKRITAGRNQETLINIGQGTRDFLQGHLRALLACFHLIIF
jgi:hypothetical protein